MYWEPDKECLDPEELEQIQIERLQSTLTRVYQHVLTSVPVSAPQFHGAFALDDGWH